MTYKHVGDAKEYAQDVVGGSIDVCKWVKLACQRQLDDLERDDIVWNPEVANNLCKFLELLPHIKGRWKTTNIVLERWQKFLLTTIFGWYRKDGFRRFRTVYIEVPRKNAKSTLTAGVGLWMLGKDGELGAEIYSAATTRDQARICFQIAKEMARRTPRYLETCGVEWNAHNLSIIGSASKFEALSAEANSLDGLNTHFAIIDELHAHKTRQVFDVLETSTGSRTQPILWNITTAGSNRAGICYEQRLYVTKLLEKVATDDTYFGVIYTIDEGDDWREESTWKKANPNYGVSVFPDDIKRLCRKAIELSSAQNSFLTKRLDVWVNADTAWMDMFAWQACGDPSLDIDQFEGKPCYVAVDLATEIDIAAVTILFEEDGEYTHFGRYYLPEDTVETSSNSQYSGWVTDGLIIATDGASTDYNIIQDYLRGLRKRFNIKELTFDPYQAHHLAGNLETEGFPMVKISVNIKNFSHPMKVLEGLVISKKFHHDGNPVLEWMISNVVCHTDSKDCILPRKERPENKIDGVVSAIMALGRILVHQEEGPSVYEKRGALVL